MTRPALPAAALGALLLAAEAIAAGAWVEHASNPGPDLAASGQSRFDQMFLHQGEYRLPYPFERLIEALERRIDNGRHSGVRQVFIPMGRSLQRDTPAPDYFKYPRRVIALEGEPVAAAGAPGRVLEYRLFIAHQPATDSLEIISYNDAAGRFEFQVAEDYAANRKPRVRPANRRMCLSCHQNAAPIFPRTPWSETNFNVEVSKRLVEALPRQFQSLIGVVTLDAGVIDVLTERANYLAAAQLIWRRGCDSARCRAAMLRAVLQYRLSSDSSFDWSAAGFRRDYETALGRNWSVYWPRGLSLADSRIPDRNPFADVSDASMDPLRVRPPHATWLEADAVLARGIILRLGGFFTRDDIRRLDRFLLETANDEPVEARTHRVSCRGASDSAGDRILNCGDNAAQQPYAEIHLEGNPETSPAPRITRLRVPNDVNLLQPDLLDVRRVDAGLLLVPGNSRSGLSLRLANGDRVNSLLLRLEKKGESVTADLEIGILSDFALIDAALEKMIARQAAGTENGLEQGAFRRGLLLPSLMSQLGITVPDWPEPRAAILASERSAGFEPDGGLALLVPYCAPCHADPGRHPPGFLHRDASYPSLRRCAPRMLARLAAWGQPQLPAPAPMPPPASPEAEGWPQSDHYRSLVAALENLAAESGGGIDWRDTDYSRLPPCDSFVSE